MASHTPRAGNQLIILIVIAVSGCRMADTEDGQAEPRRGKLMTMDSDMKFKDPLLNTADRDSDEGEVVSVSLKNKAG